MERAERQKKSPGAVEASEASGFGVEADQEPLRGAGGIEPPLSMGRGATLKNFLFYFFRVTAIMFTIIQSDEHFGI